MARSGAYYRGYADAADWVRNGMDQLNTPACPYTTENAGQQWARQEYCDGWNNYFERHA